MYNDNQEEMRDHNHEVFNTYFQQSDDWIMEYVQSDDYVGEYAYLMKESDSINRQVKRLLGKDYYMTPNSFDSPRDEAGIMWVANLPDDLVDYVVEAILYYDLFDCVVHDEYSSTHEGYLDSFQIGEYENQLEISHIKEATESSLSLSDSETTFEDLLAEYIETNRDHCLRGTLAELKRDYACFYQFVNTGLRIDFQLNRDQWEQVTTHGMLAYCRHVDRNRRDTLSVKS